MRWSAWPIVVYVGRVVLPLSGHAWELGCKILSVPGEMPAVGLNNSPNVTWLLFCLFPRVLEVLLCDMFVLGLSFSNVRQPGREFSAI